MPVVPSKYVQWITDKRRTPIELFNMISSDFTADEQDADENEGKEDFQPVLNYCIIACQGKCNQQFNAVLDQSEDCRRWMTKRLEDTLGKGETEKVAGDYHARHQCQASAHRATCMKMAEGRERQQLRR